MPSPSTPPPTTPPDNVARSNRVLDAPEAVLREAVILPLADGFILVGHIHQDSRGIFEDGERIRTTFVQKWLGNNIYRTYNTTYEVHFADTMRGHNIQSQFNAHLGVK